MNISCVGPQWVNLALDLGRPTLQCTQNQYAAGPAPGWGRMLHKKLRADFWHKSHGRRRRPGIALSVLVQIRRPGYRWTANELGYRSCSCDFAGRHLWVEIIATGGNMRLGDIKNVTAHRGYIKWMLQLKWVVLGSSYFSFISIVSPTPVAASMAIVCGRCTAHLMGMVRIVDRRANAPSTKCCLS